MTGVHVCHDALDDRQRGDRVFAGDLVIFAAVPGLGAFRDRVDQLVRDEFGTANPETAQFELPRPAYTSAVRNVRQRVRADTTAHGLLCAALANAGVDTSAAYWDWVHLRVLPHGSEHASAGTGWHRDTWSSNVHAQTNWWTPIYPITTGRALRFAIEHWSEPVANTSDDWSPRAVKAQQHNESSERTAVPVIPEPLTDLRHVRELCVVVQPGDLLCFSGTHLHASVPNESGLARFSVEVRTVHQADIDTGRGAPNIDSHAPSTRYRWFHHVEHGTPVTGPAA
ncbi:MAG: hypothetical protein GEU97_14965 [Actinophytocola sp.]|nr:hypothetical protein [Actinophytocola sp.]